MKTMAKWNQWRREIEMKIQCQRESRNEAMKKAAANGEIEAKYRREVIEEMKKKKKI